MRTAPRAAAWAAWAAWTCNPPQRVFGQKRAGFEPALFFGNDRHEAGAAHESSRKYLPLHVYLREIVYRYNMRQIWGFAHMKSLIAPALCGLLLLLSVPAQADAAKNCHIGSYRLSDGQAFDIAPSDGDTLRWRAFTGETGRLHQNKDGSWTSTFGWTDKPDGRTVSFSDCTRGEITFGKETGKRIAFDV